MKRYSTLALSVALVCAASGFDLAAAQGQENAKPPSSPTLAAHQMAQASLPEDGTRDADFSTRGFLATRKDPLIKDEKGNIVWNLDAYRFVEGEAPASVHPSLWRHMRYLKHHGLYQVTDGIWQVRGFDLSNMTIIEGKTGWIVIDPLTTMEVAAAAMELVNQTLGERPVRAVLYSHSHADHFGGVRGVISREDVLEGRVQVIAPDGFTEEASSENVMAGGAMLRRAAYQFGRGIEPGAMGQMGSGIGTAVSAGTLTLIPPTDTISKTGEKRVVDGIELEFQIVSGSEAPAEFNIFIEPAKTFLAAEIATCTLHNILTPRGAKVRDTRAWARYLDEAVLDYAPRSQIVISSHCWPQFGQEEGTRWLSAHRDNYRYLHDQTVRRMNQGQTMVEIAESLALPEGLAREWATHDYYGTYNHNAKAIYQYYLGWYDAVPANLHPHPPVERARRLVEAIGGPDRVMKIARSAMDRGDYRWSSDLLQQLVFAEPGNAAAKAMLADSYEQQGYQAESAIWRNQFLVAARELRGGSMEMAAGQSADLIEAIPTQLLLDSAATRFAPERFTKDHLVVQFEVTDRKESAMIETNRHVMIARIGRHADRPDVVVRAPRAALLGLFFLKLPVTQLQATGVQMEGDVQALQQLIDSLDPMATSFPIVLP